MKTRTLPFLTVALLAASLSAAGTVIGVIIGDSLAARR